jgi:hypothetical protein
MHLLTVQIEDTAEAVLRKSNLLVDKRTSERINRSSILAGE